MTDDSAVSWVTERYPPAAMTPAEFEEFVTELFSAGIGMLTT